MSCVICEIRKEKRVCPAVHGRICAQCCGEQREVTLDCPSDCPYLQQAREHEYEGHAITPCIPYLPATDEKIEGQVVDPSGQDEPVVGEKQHNSTERIESTLVAAPVGENEHQVEAG